MVKKFQRIKLSKSVHPNKDIFQVMEIGCGKQSAYDQKMPNIPSNALMVVFLLLNM